MWGEGNEKGGENGCEFSGEVFWEVYRWCTRRTETMEGNLENETAMVAGMGKGLRKGNCENDPWKK